MVAVLALEELGHVLHETAVKFDLDPGTIPKVKTVNWTTSPAEIERMVDQTTAPGGRGTERRHLRRHVRAIRRSGRAASRKAHGAADLMWVEELVPAENVDTYKLHCPRKTSTSICAGEKIFLAHGFRRLLEMGGVDIVSQTSRGLAALAKGSG